MAGLSERERVVKELLNCEGQGNDRCADCHSTKVAWVSTNLGAFLCIACAGHHRKLGVQISRVQSLEFDDSILRTKDDLLKKGNEKNNQLFEARVPAYHLRPCPSVSQANCQEEESKTQDELRGYFIRLKYVKRVFEEGKLSVNDMCIDRMPQEVFAFVFKTQKARMGIGRMAEKWFVLINAKIQIFPAEGSLGAPTHTFNVCETDISILDEENLDFTFELKPRDPDKKSIAVTCDNIEEFVKAFHKIKRAQLYYKAYPSESRGDDTKLAAEPLDPVSLRASESMGWAHQTKAGMKNLTSRAGKHMKRNRRFWTLIGTKLFKFKENVKSAQDPVTPTGGIELKGASVYIDKTRKNTIIIHTEDHRFALAPEESDLQKMLMILPQRVMSFTEHVYVDFKKDKLRIMPVKKRGNKTLSIPAGAGSRVNSFSNQSYISIDTPRLAEEKEQAELCDDPRGPGYAPINFTVDEDEDPRGPGYQPAVMNQSGNLDGSKLKAMHQLMSDSTLDPDACPDLPAVDFGDEGSAKDLKGSKGSLAGLPPPPQRRNVSQDEGKKPSAGVFAPAPPPPNIRPSKPKKLAKVKRGDAQHAAKPPKAPQLPSLDLPNSPPFNKQESVDMPPDIPSMDAEMLSPNNRFTSLLDEATTELPTGPPLPPINRDFSEESIDIGPPLPPHEPSVASSPGRSERQPSGPPPPPPPEAIRGSKKKLGGQPPPPPDRRGSNHEKVPIKTRPGKRPVVGLHRALTRKKSKKKSEEAGPSLTRKKSRKSPPPLPPAVTALGLRK